MSSPTDASARAISAQRNAALAPPAFFIFGAPRSGTTLARRLCTELPGVFVTNETHFMIRFTGKPEWNRYPLDEPTLRDIAARFRSGIFGTIDAERLVRFAGGAVGSPRDLLTAMVHAMSDDSPVLGEKTPRHVRYWRTLHAWYPDAKFIGLVRDPRHQVPSQREKEWGTRNIRLAARLWRDDNAALLEARGVLSEDQLLILHHDEMILQPDATRTRIADHLGVPHGPLDLEHNEPVTELHREAFAAIDPSHTTRRANSLSASEQRLVATVCRRQMQALGYSARPSYPGWIGDSVAAADRAAEVTVDRTRPALRRLRRRVSNRTGLRSK